MTDVKSKPSHNIFVKTYKGVESRIGSQIGVGFTFKEGQKGQGINIILDALPIHNSNGQIEIVAFSTETTA